MIKNFIELTKIRIGFLVLTTTLIGFYLGNQGFGSNELLFYTLDFGSAFSTNVVYMMSPHLDCNKVKTTKGAVSARRILGPNPKV